ncbi:MAG: PKD domain-containing protein, partial [Methanobacteriota archaeon]
MAKFDIVRALMHVDVDAGASTDPDDEIQAYTWDFEDDGTVDASGVEAAFDYAVPGRYAVRLRVTDAAGQEGTATRFVSVANTTLDFEFWDFFAVPFGEWWDYRAAVYGELQVGSECYTSIGIANGVCTPSDASVQDVASYPYTHWSDLPEGRGWSSPDNAPSINAPYRLRATGVAVPGYTLAEPVFLPVLNASQPPGSRLYFDWSMDFLDTATADALEARGCSISRTVLDGYHIRSEIDLTMDLMESRRVFDVDALDATAAQAWWDANTDPTCTGYGRAEADVQAWFLAMGGSPIDVGVYDIYNAYEWFWDPAFTEVAATVDADGTTHVTIHNVAWGTGNLLTRMFYWGNAAYRD